MHYYFLLVVIAGIIAGIIITMRSKKEEGLVYGTLDKVGIITNIILIPAYLIASIFCFYLVNENFMLTPKSVVAVGYDVVEMSGIIFWRSKYTLNVSILLYA